MSDKREIAVITGSRAEFGLLRPVLEKIKNDPELELKLYVTGMHVEGRFGRTMSEITDAGFDIEKAVDIFLKDDSHRGVARSASLSMMGFADVFAKSQPDILLVLGDRFEIFGAVGAAAVFGIPVAHIHGGELTEGVMDDAFRHSITKMSHIHFAATKEYADRIIQMGEQPDRVFNTGTPAVDAAINAKPVSSDELGVRFGRKNLLITFHPVVLDDMSPSEQFTELLEALTETDAYLIFTYANADMGGAEINEMIEKYVADNSRRSVAVKSFGHQKYISVMKKCDGLVGNSSSGLIEAGALKKGVVNIGIRQRGRVRSANVIDCGNSRQDISQAINMLMSGGFQESLDGCESAYGDGQSADRILYALKTIDLGGINIKKFNDLEQK